MNDEQYDTDFLLQNLMEHMPDNIYFKDVDSRFIMANQAFCSWVGCASEEVAGKTDFDLFAEAHARQAYEDERRIIATGEPLMDAEEKETWADGRITWVSSTKMPLKDDQGAIIGTFGVSRDITDRKEAEFKAAYYDEQMSRIRGRMEEDVRLAGDLQRSFFPSTYPFFPAAGDPAQNAVEFLHHYEPSGIVSGDFCTVFKLSEHEAGLFLCDVMGHGVRAALVTALVCAMIEEVSDLKNDPGKYLERINELLFPILRHDDMLLYATACYMVFDASTGQLRYANAGHPVPLLFPGKGGKARWLTEENAARGPALAIAEEAEYSSWECTLHPGDRVITYTDGLFEVESAEGEEFGEERLLAAAQKVRKPSLSKLFGELTAAAESFAGPGGFDDDLCLAGFTFNRSM